MEHLFTHQQAVVPDVLRALRPGNPTVLVAPTGCGKTIIAAEIALHFKTVLWVAHRIELIDQAKAENGRNVQVMSVSAALRHGPRFVDLLIIDEAHRGMAASYRSLVEKYNGACVLGLTATPMRTDGQGLIDVFLEIVQCSSVKELVDSGYLVPYRALEARDEALRQLADMRKRRGDYDQSQLSALMSIPRLVGDVVREYKKHAAGRKAVAFCVSIKHSRILTEAFLSAGVRAAHLDGRASPSIRREQLDRLRKGKIDVLCNVNLFTEGWDCPSVSCVIMARPTQSLTLYLQCVGRGMRTCEGKENLLILDHAGNIARHGYPDDPREWSLESERQRLSREAEIAELERLHALGFDSIEDELEEKARRFEETYSTAEACRILGIDQSSIKHFLAARGVDTWNRRTLRYPKRDIELIRANMDLSMMVRDVCLLPDAHLISKVTSVESMGGRLRFFGIAPQTGRGWPDPRYRPAFLKSDVERILRERRLLLEDTVSPLEANELLGLSSNTRTATWLKKHGIETIERGRYPRSEIEALVHRRQSTRADYYSPIEARTIIGTTNIAAILRHAGFSIRADIRGGFPKHDVDLLRSNIDKSITLMEVCKMTSRSTGTVQGALKRAGVFTQKGLGWPRRSSGRLLRSEVDQVIKDMGWGASK